LLSGSASAKQTEQPALDAEIEKLVHAGIVSPEIALAHALDPKSLAKKLATPAK
jgi:hypothetical protein